MSDDIVVSRKLLERLHSGWLNSTDVVGPMWELRTLLDQPASAQDEREAFEAFWTSTPILKHNKRTIADELRAALQELDNK